MPSAVRNAITNQREAKVNRKRKREREVDDDDEEERGGGGGGGGGGNGPIIEFYPVARRLIGRPSRR